MSETKFIIVDKWTNVPLPHQYSSRVDAEEDVDLIFRPIWEMQYGIGNSNFEVQEVVVD